MNGGARPGAGRPPGFPGVKWLARTWCKQAVAGQLEPITDNPTLENVRKRVAEDPDYWLRIFEHAYGRPPQAQDDTGDTIVERHEFTLPGGAVLSPGATGLPASSSHE